MRISQENDYTIVHDIKDFSPIHTFDCGQCFRFERQADQSYIGIAYDRPIHIFVLNDNIHLSCNLDDFNNIWRKFLDLDRDYNSIRNEFITDEFTRNAAKFGEGIRILAQEPWEALCSFIISQCNNIPRIKGIVERLCTNFGSEIEFRGKTYHTFPSYKRIAELGIDELDCIRAGYRSQYILSAAQSLANASFSFDKLAEMDTKTARKEVMSLHGVGAKVADCFLLFGMSKLDAFPIDTWMKKAKAVYTGDMNPEIYGKYAGIYQQYIFYYAKECYAELSEIR